MFCISPITDLTSERGRGSSLTGAPDATLDRGRRQCCLDTADGERLRNRLQEFAVGGGIVALPAGRRQGQAGSCAPGGWRDASGSRSGNRGAPRKRTIATIFIDLLVPLKFRFDS